MNKKYDVFISSKSEDYRMAEKVYDYFIHNGLSVFFACKELQRIGDAQYAMAIDEALDSTTHMVVVASSLKNINSKWIQYEWSTFSNDLKSGYRQGNLLTILTDSVELKSLPPSLRHQQSFRYNNFINIIEYVGSGRIENDLMIEYSAEVFGSLIQKGNCGDISQSFIFPVEDLFYIKGRGIVVTGRIERGEVHVGDNVFVVGYGKEYSSKCIGIEMHRQLWEEAKAGDEVGLLLSGLNKTDVSIGQVVTTDKYCILESRLFSCDCSFLNSDKSYKITDSQSLDFYIRTAKVSGRLEFPNGINYVSPNDYLPIKVNLTSTVPINRGLVFAICYDNKTIGVGIVKNVF
ncbi:MAG: EF-Tu/IF-2/RF-3 family GTPase [Candidatus Cryptobacteroides sp.]